MVMLPSCVLVMLCDAGRLYVRDSVCVYMCVWVCVGVEQKVIVFIIV